MFVVGAAGWYKNADLQWVFPIGAILCQIGVLIWGLRQTAAAGRRYGRQILAGFLICVVAGVIIVAVSMVWSGLVFTDVFEVTAELVADQMADQGLSDEQIDERLAMTAFTRTPVFQSIIGLIWNLITGLIISLIAAAFVRHKD
jgi:hypothetical protein